MIYFMVECSYYEVMCNSLLLTRTLIRSTQFDAKLISDMKSRFSWDNPLLIRLNSQIRY